MAEQEQKEQQNPIQQFQQGLEWLSKGTQENLEWLSRGTQENLERLQNAGETIAREAPRVGGFIARGTEENLNRLTGNTPEADPRVAETIEQIAKLQQEAASNTNPKQQLDALVATFDRLSANTGSLYDVMVTPENAEAWKGSHEEVIRFYQEEFPKLHISEQRAIAQNIAMLENVDIGLGESQPGAGGAYALAMVIHKQTHDISDGGGVALTLGQNVFQRLGSAVSEGWGAAVQAFQQGEGFGKFTGAIGAFGSKFMETMSHSPQNYAEDLLVERIGAVQRDAAALGFAPNFSEFIGVMATDTAVDLVGEKSGGRLTLNPETIHARLQQGGNTQIVNNPSPTQNPAVVDIPAQSEYEVVNASYTSPSPTPVVPAAQTTQVAATPSH